MTCIDHMLGGPGPASSRERPAHRPRGAVHRPASIERLVGEVRYAFEALVRARPDDHRRRVQPAVRPGRRRLRRDGRGRASSCDGRPRAPALAVPARSRAAALPQGRATPPATSATGTAPAARSARTRLAAGLQEIPVDVAVRFRADRRRPDRASPACSSATWSGSAHPSAGPSRRDRRRRRLRPRHPRAAGSAPRRPRRRRPRTRRTHDQRPGAHRRDLAAAAWRDNVVPAAAAVARAAARPPSALTAG